MKLEKGMLISVDSWWYIVVDIAFDIENRCVEFYCICDNANNIYHWTSDEIHSHISLNELSDSKWMRMERKISPWLKDRDIPHDVIIEVLAGEHDDRFDHWIKDET